MSRVQVIEIIRVEEGAVFQVDLDLLSTHLLGLIDPIRLAAEIEGMDEELLSVIRRNYYQGVRGFFRKLFGRKLQHFPSYLLDPLVERVRKANSEVLSIFLGELLESLRSFRLPEHTDVVLISNEEGVEGV